MRKIITILFAILLAISCVACNNKKDESKFVPKPVDGVPLCFDDGTSYYSVSPAFIQEGNKLYAYYTSNATAKKRDTSIILRIGTMGENGWEFGERQVVLSPTENSWDAGSVSDADITKGEFKYKNATYNYLMVYQGCKDKSERNQQIGIALANAPEGPFVKVEKPIIKYDERVSGYAWGVGQPSIISEDQKGKVRLYYSVGESLYTYTMTAELDLSDCENVLGAEGAFMMPIEGLVDGVKSETIFNNAGFARKGENLVVARDFNPVAGVEPIVAQAVQVAKMPISGTYSDTSSWEIIEDRINDIDLAGEDIEKYGWSRVYAACIVKDFFGNMVGDKPTLAITVTSFEEETREYRYYQGIIIYTSDYYA